MPLMMTIGCHLSDTTLGYNVTLYNPQSEPIQVDSVTLVFYGAGEELGSANSSQDSGGVSVVVMPKKTLVSIGDLSEDPLGLETYAPPGATSCKAISWSGVPLSN